MSTTIQDETAPADQAEAERIAHLAEFNARFNMSGKNLKAKYRCGSR